MTSDATRRRIEQFVGDALGKQTILCQDRAGFVVNALLVPYLLSAIRMLESGFASAAGHRHRHGRSAAPIRWDRCDSPT